MNNKQSIWQKLRTRLAHVFKWRFRRQSSNALSELRSCMQSIARGEYSQKLSPYVFGTNNDLAVVFNDMAVSVEKVIAAATADRDRFSIVLSHMADGILVVDRDTRITLINTAAQRIFKLSEHEAIGRSFIEASHNAEVYSVLRLCLDSGKQQSRFVETFTNRLYLGVVATPLYNSQGCILLVQNLTEVRRLETVRRDFVSNVSHELRTPIASIKAISETLNSGALEDPTVARDFLQLIEVEVDKLAQMINELGELSSIESGAGALVKIPCDVNLLAHSVANRMCTQISRHNLEITTSVSDALPLVMLDYDKLERVLVNLVYNSIKFTPTGGRITIAAELKDDKIVVSVADTGTGIEPSDLPRIFERFYKADKARSSGGTGLGLAIARHTVEAHGGRIWAESVYGKGTTIYFTLPVGGLVF